MTAPSLRPWLTPHELKAARQRLGLSASRFAMVVNVESERTVRRWEAGERDIPGPVIVLTHLLLESPEARRLLRVEGAKLWETRGRQKPPA